MPSFSFCERNKGRAGRHCESPNFRYSTSTFALRFESPLIFQAKPIEMSVGRSTTKSSTIVLTSADELTTGFGCPRRELTRGPKAAKLRRLRCTTMPLIFGLMIRRLVYRSLLCGARLVTRCVDRSRVSSSLPQIDSNRFPQKSSRYSSTTVFAAPISPGSFCRSGMIRGREPQDCFGDRRE